MSSIPGTFVDFVDNKSFATREELNTHLAKSKRQAVVHSPCDVCGVQQHVRGDLRVNAKTGTPKIFCDSCKADLIADMGASA